MESDLIAAFHKCGDAGSGVRSSGFRVRRTNPRTSVFLCESRTPNPDTMSARRFFLSQSALATLALAACLFCLPVKAAAQRGGGGHGGFGGGGLRGGFGGARMAAPARTSRPSSFGSRPMTFVARGPQSYRGFSRYVAPRYSRGGVSRSSYHRPMTRRPIMSAGVSAGRGSGPAGGNRFARPAPGSTRLGARASTQGSRSGQDWQRFGGDRHHHRFHGSNFWFNPFYNPYFSTPFFWSAYPFCPACGPYYSDYGDESGYTNDNWPVEENEAEAPAEENVAPEPEATSGEESQMAPEPLDQTVVVELADGRTKTFTWKGNKMIVTESPAPSKTTPAAPAPQHPPARQDP